MATVRAPDGREWWVGRRWSPRPRWRSRKRKAQPEAEPKERSRWYDWLDSIHMFDLFDPETPLGLILIALAAAVLAGLLVFLAWPLLLFLVDVTVAILLVVGGIAARVFFRRPWVIEARHGSIVHRWHAVGWRQSAALIEQAKLAILAGLPMPRDSRSMP